MGFGGSQGGSGMDLFSDSLPLLILRLMILLAAKGYSVRPNAAGMHRFARFPRRSILLYSHFAWNAPESYRHRSGLAAANLGRERKLGASR